MADKKVPKAIIDLWAEIEKKRGKDECNNARAIEAATDYWVAAFVKKSRANEVLYEMISQNVVRDFLHMFLTESDGLFSIELERRLKNYYEKIIILALKVMEDKNQELLKQHVTENELMVEIELLRKKTEEDK